MTDFMQDCHVRRSRHGAYGHDEAPCGRQLLATLISCRCSCLSSRNELRGQERDHGASAASAMPPPRQRLATPLLQRRSTSPLPSPPSRLPPPQPTTLAIAAISAAAAPRRPPTTPPQPHLRRHRAGLTPARWTAGPRKSCKMGGKGPKTCACGANTHLKCLPAAQRGPQNFQIPPHQNPVYTSTGRRQTEPTPKQTSTVARDLQVLCVFTRKNPYAYTPYRI